jgi:hypothetical protein
VPNDSTRRSFNGQDFSGLISDPSSVRTGLGRKHWEAVADHLLDGGFRQPRSAPWSLDFPGRASVYGQGSDGLEGFARLLKLGAYRSVHAADHELGAWYPMLLDGLEGAGNALLRRAGNAWPELNVISQPLVEAASIALAITASPRRFWDPLSEQAQFGLQRWLGDALHHRGIENNWVFFPASVAAFFQSVVGDQGIGVPALGRMKKAVSDLYLGDGWYSDGPGRRVDYYNAWSFHYYVPLIARHTDDEVLKELAVERIEQFLTAHRLMFDHDGAPIYFGRSLTYRFATAAPFFAAGIIGADTEYQGTNRLIASRSLNYFVDSGAIQNGILTVGWRQDQPEIAQEYSSGASPLWASKAFVGLLLEPDDPVWRSPEPTAAEERLSLPETHCVGSGGLLISRSESQRVSQLAVGAIEKWPDWSPRSLAADPLYDRISYSSVTAPNLGGGSPDNSLEVVHEGVSGRLGPIARFAAGNNWLLVQAPIWDKHAKSLRIPYRVTRVLRRFKAAWAPTLWRASAQIGVIFHLGVEYRIARVTGIPEGSVVRLSSYPVGLNAVSLFKSLLPNSHVTKQADSDPMNPFGVRTTTEVASITSTDGTALLITASIISSQQMKDVTIGTVDPANYAGGTVIINMPDGVVFVVDPDLFQVEQIDARIARS